MNRRAVFYLESKTEDSIQEQAISALEQGQVLYFPSLPFPIHHEEAPLLSPDKVTPQSKNISYDLKTGALSGTCCQGEEAFLMKGMIHRFTEFSFSLIKQLFPSYLPHIKPGRTSFRPVEITGRVSSYRKNDTLLHVDSFSATPMRGQRILRLFTNINPDNKPRVWRVGSPFPEVVKTMAPRIKNPIPGWAFLLKALHLTRGKRSLYDDYMLQIHNHMKADQQYQRTVSQEELLFMPGETWIVYTDQVSHAAMSGQHVLEQTFYLPQKAMQDPNSTPLAVLEHYFKKNLI